mmetsp:Transcript_29297/g.75518  ORF Transcript_29297/g.75518 Transcript_29297/m.75518 type:complete len:498 (+) Transcript_29297:110-1603(+)
MVWQLLQRSVRRYAIFDYQPDSTTSQSEHELAEAHVEISGQSHVQIQPNAAEKRAAAPTDMACAKRVACSTLMVVLTCAVAVKGSGPAWDQSQGNSQRPHVGLSTVFAPSTPPSSPPFMPQPYSLQTKPPSPRQPHVAQPPLGVHLIWHPPISSTSAAPLPCPVVPPSASSGSAINRCDSWCPGHRQRWRVKCGFLACAGCNQCSQPPLPPSTPVLQSCYCFDLCSASAALSFIRATSHVLVNETDAKWHQYLQAVYRGRMPVPIHLDELTFFYANSPTWRSRYGRNAPSPFRDCLDEAQQRCSRCVEEWTQHPPEPVPTVLEVGIWIATTTYRRSPANLPGALLYAKSRSFGHQTLNPNSWVEVMRHRQPGEGLDSFGGHGSHEYAGCFFRPARGSGIWMNTGSTFLAGTDTRLRTVIMRAIAERYDSVQWTSVDFDDQAPMVVVTLLACHNLSRITDAAGIGTCPPLEVELKSGWHDLDCDCNDDWASLNCARSV